MLLIRHKYAILCADTMEIISGSCYKRTFLHSDLQRLQMDSRILAVNIDYTHEARIPIIILYIRQGPPGTELPASYRRYYRFSMMPASQL